MNRRIVIIAGLALLGCVILAGGLAALYLLRQRDGVAEVAPLVSPDGEPDASLALPQGDAEAQMAAVEGQVTELRELEPTGPVVKSFMTEDALRTRLEADFAEDYSVEEARDDALMLSAFDFLSSDLDLYALYLNLYAEQIAGFYDTEDEEFFLISSDATLGGFERLTFAHEYTHALQDQHFDLDSYDRETLYDENRDAGRALDALIEGDAQYLTGLYLAGFYSAEDMQALFEELEGFDSPVLENAPPIVVRELSFPYEAGNAFVQALYEEGGWRRVDDAFANPPTSTEHILHPEQYLRSDIPQPVGLEPGLDALGAGWRLVAESTFGEFYLQAYLEQQLDLSTAAAAAEGWGGDRYAVFEEGQTGQLALLLLLAWDRPADADEFVQAFRQYGAARSGRDPTTDNSDLTCWTAQDYLCVAHKGNETWVVLGPNRPTVNGLLAQYQIAG